MNNYYLLYAIRFTYRGPPARGPALRSAYKNESRSAAAVEATCSYPAFLPARGLLAVRRSVVDKKKTRVTLIKIAFFYNEQRIKISRRLVLKKVNFKLNIFVLFFDIFSLLIL